MAQRDLTVHIIGDSRSLERAFTRSSKSAQTFDNSLGRAGRGALSAAVSFRGLGRALAFSSNAFLGGAGLVFGIRAASSAASNLAEQTTKTQQVFGSSAKIVQAFAKDALGLANDQALQTASSIGALLRPMGLTGKASAELSIRLTQLGTDFSSFFNTDTADALQAIQSGLVGEVEPLRRYGVLLSEARVQQEALAETGKKSVKALTAQEKVQARITLIFRDSAQAQGDYARTQGGLANTQRDLAKNIRNLEIAVGQALNPTILEVTRSLNKWLSDSENQKQVQKDVATAVKGTVTVIKDFAAVVRTGSNAVGGFTNLVGILIGLKVSRALTAWAVSLGLVRDRTIAAAGANAALAASERSVASSAVVARVAGYTSAVAAGGTAASVAATRVAGLRTALAGLNAVTVAPIVIPVVLSVFEKERNFVKDKLGNVGKFGFDLLQAVAGGGTGHLGEDIANLFRKQIEKVPKLPKPLGVAGPGGFDALGFTGVDLTKLGGGDRNRGGLTAAQRNTFFDNAIARIVQRGGLGEIHQQIAALQKANELIAARLKVTKDVTRRLTLEDELLQNTAQIKTLNTQAAAEALTKRQDVFSEFIANLQLGVTKAQATASFADDIAKLKLLQAGIQSEIKEFGRTADLTGQLFDVRQQIVQATKDQAAKRISDLTSKQFRQLGLTATGDEITPQVANLKKRLAQLTENLSGSTLNTPKLQTQLAKFRKVLSEGLVPKDVRAKIKEMLDGIADDLKNHSGRLTKFAKLDTSKFVQGITGLTPGQAKQLRAGLSQIGAGGTVPRRSLAAAGAGSGDVVVQHTTILDGGVLERSTTRYQQKRRRRNPGQRRGPHAGA